MRSERSEIIFDLTKIKKEHYKKYMQTSYIVCKGQSPRKKLLFIK